MDLYLHFENPSPTFPVVYQGLADDVSLVLAYIFPQGFFCTGLRRECTALLSRLCLGALGSFLGTVEKRVIIRFDLTFLEEVISQFLVSLYQKHFSKPFLLLSEDLLNIIKVQEA